MTFQKKSKDQYQMRFTRVHYAFQLAHLLYQDRLLWGTVYIFVTITLLNIYILKVKDLLPLTEGNTIQEHYRINDHRKSLFELLQ